MHQYVVGNVPDEGEKRVVLFVVHRILDLRVIKRQFAPHLYEALQVMALALPIMRLFLSALYTQYLRW